MSAELGGLGHVSGLDPGADWLESRARPLSESVVGPVLRGDWLGHSLHPMLTDVTIGCWTSAAIVDLLGGRGGRTVARRLVGVGVLCALPTASSGLVEYATIPADDHESRRIGAVHAGLNLAALVSYARSWLARRRGRHLRGIAWSAVGAVAASASGHLGGHLTLVRGIGHGARGGAVGDGAPVGAPVEVTVDGPVADGTSIAADDTVGFVPQPNLD